MHVGVNGLGCVSSIVVVSASLMATKATVFASFQLGLRSPPCGALKWLLSGSGIVAQLTVVKN